MGLQCRPVRQQHQASRAPRRAALAPAALLCTRQSQQPAGSCTPASQPCSCAHPHQARSGSSRQLQTQPCRWCLAAQQLHVHSRAQRRSKPRRPQHQDLASSRPSVLQHLARTRGQSATAAPAQMRRCHLAPLCCASAHDCQPQLPPYHPRRHQGRRLRSAPRPSSAGLPLPAPASQRPGRPPVSAGVSGTSQQRLASSLASSSTSATLWPSSSQTHLSSRARLPQAALANLLRASLAASRGEPGKPQAPSSQRPLPSHARSVSRWQQLQPSHPPASY